MRLGSYIEAERTDLEFLEPPLVPSRTDDHLTSHRRHVWHAYSKRQEFVLHSQVNAVKLTRAVSDVVLSRTSYLSLSRPFTQIWHLVEHTPVKSSFGT